MQGHSLQKSATSGANLLFPTKVTCWLPGRAANWLRNKQNEWCTSLTHKTMHIPQSHYWSWQDWGLYRSPFVKAYMQLGAGVVLKLGALRWCKHLCMMKLGWLVTKQPQKCEVLGCCVWTDWNIFKKCRTSGQIFEAAVQQQWLRFSERVNDWLNDSIMQMLLKILLHAVKFIHACVGEGEDCEDFNNYLRK